MPTEEDLAAIVDIVAAARQATQFVEGIDLEAFHADAKTFSAVILQIHREEPP